MWLCVHCRDFAFVCTFDQPKFWITYRKKKNCNFDLFSEEEEGEIDSDEEEEEMETAGKTFVVNVHKPNLIKQV